MGRSKSDKAGDGPDRWLARILQRRFAGIPFVIWVSGILLATTLIIAFGVSNPTPPERIEFRLIFGSCAAFISTLLFGRLNLKGPFQKFDVEANGPLAVFFLLVFLVDPTASFSQAVAANQATTNLIARGCEDEKVLKSLNGDHASSFSVINKNTLPVRVYWLDYEGHRKLYSRLATGDAVVQPTYLTHPWLIADDQNNCIAIYLPATETPFLEVKATVAAH